MQNLLYVSNTTTCINVYEYSYWFAKCNLFESDNLIIEELHTYVPNVNGANLPFCMVEEQAGLQESYMYGFNTSLPPY
jgi:hypothetical protein